MAKRISTDAPKLLLAKPEPVLESRRFHNRELPIWVGEVHLDSIRGWIGNPRTELFAEDFRMKFGRDPSDDDMYQLVLNDDDHKEGLRIRELAGSIYRNGVRVPIVLTHEGILLDGNRRYYACSFLVREGSAESERERFKRIPALVLPEDTDADTESAIITEFNFIPDGWLEWPYYVKATRVYEDSSDGLDKKKLQEKYGLPWDQLRTWIKARELCERFLYHHHNGVLAKQFAYRNFIMFDEMARRYMSRFEDTDFSEAIFEILLDGYADELHRFTSSQDVIRLREIRDNAEAWDALTSRRGKEALKDALRILEVSAYDKSADTNKRLERINSNLDKLVSTGALTTVQDNLLEQFHEYAERLPGSAIDPAARVEKMITWLDSFTAREMAFLDVNTLDKLREALERVLVMAEAVKTRERT